MSSRELVPVSLPAPVPAPAPGRRYRFVGLILLGLGLAASAVYLLAHRSAPPPAKVAVAMTEPELTPQPAPLPVPNPVTPRLVAQLDPPPPAPQAEPEIPVLPPPAPQADPAPPAQEPVPAPGWKLAPDEAPPLTTGSIGARALAVLVNRDVDGFDYRVVKETSLADCQRSCEADGRCRAYTFNTWQHVCFLKASATAQRIEPRGISGTKPGASPRSAQRRPTIERIPLQQFPGAPYRFVRPADYVGCARQCLADAACLGFNFNTAAGSCGLFASLDRPVRNELTIAGMKWQPPLVEVSANRRRGPAFRHDLPPEAAALFDSVFGQFLR